MAIEATGRIDIDELFKKEAFDSLSLERKLSFKSLLKNIEGRSIQESMSYIMGFISTMPKNAQMTKAQQEAMLEAVADSLPDGDGKKFKSILQMLHK